MRHRLSAPLVGALIVVLGAGSVPAVAAPPGTGTAERTGTTKQAGTAERAGTGTRTTTRAEPDPSKPRHAPAADRQVWSVTLEASRTRLWPDQETSLTATANREVGPTPFYISIYDTTARVPANQRRVAVCGSGTTCEATVSFSDREQRTYVAYVGQWTDAYPPQGVVATSEEVEVSWGIQNWSTGLRLSRSTARTGSAVNITLRTRGEDIGPSPFFFSIYDRTTRSRVALCGTGTTCRARVSQDEATTHRYVGFLGTGDDEYPPSRVWWATQHAFVTWSRSGYTVNLSLSDGPYEAVARTNRDVGPTPYFITIYNVITGDQLAMCGSGRECRLPSPPCRANLVAFVGGAQSSLPPPDTQASSQPIRARACAD